MQTSYKQTEIGKIPEEWEVKKLGDSSIATIIMGQSPPSNTYNESGEGMPFLQGNADFGSLYPSPTKFTTRPMKVAKQNDVLISVRAPVGEINLSSSECCIGRGLAAIRVNTAKLDHIFTFYYLRHAINRLLSYATGSTFTAIRKDDLEVMKIGLPPLHEQQKIASILSTVDDAIQKTDEIIRKTQVLKKGLMQRLLTKGIGHTKFKKTEVGEIPEEWEVVKVGSVCQGIVPGRYKPKRFDGDIPWITLPDIEDRYISDSKSGLRVSVEEIKRVGGKIIPRNSVIMSCVGELGIVAITTTDVVINQQLHAFVCPENVDPYFLAIALMSQVNYMRSIATTTVVPYMNKDNCNSIPIPLPSPSEQKKIVSIISAADGKLETEKCKRNQLEEVKKGLMQVLLTGKVRVKVN